MNVVKLHSGPSLNDIPGRLRYLADQIEAGEHGDVYSLLVLMPHPNDFPSIFGFGDIEGDNQPVVQLEMAKHQFIANIMARR